MATSNISHRSLRAVLKSIAVFTAAMFLACAPFFSSAFTFAAPTEHPAASPSPTPTGASPSADTLPESDSSSPQNKPQPNEPLTASPSPQPSVTPLISETQSPLPAPAPLPESHPSSQPSNTTPSSVSHPHDSSPVPPSDFLLPPSTSLTNEPSPLFVSVAEDLTEESKEITWEVTFSPAELDTWFISHGARFSDNSSPFVLNNYLLAPLALKDTPWVLFRETADERVKLTDSSQRNSDDTEGFRLGVVTQENISEVSMSGPWNYDERYTLTFTSVLTEPIKYETQYSTILSFRVPTHTHTLIAFTQLHPPIPSSDPTGIHDQLPSPHPTPAPSPTPLPTTAPTLQPTPEPVVNKPSHSPLVPGSGSTPVSGSGTHITVPSLPTSPTIPDQPIGATAVNAIHSSTSSFRAPSYRRPHSSSSPVQHLVVAPAPPSTHHSSPQQTRENSSPKPAYNITGIDSPQVGNTLALPHSSQGNLSSLGLTVGKATLLSLAIITVGAALCVRRYTI